MARPLDLFHRLLGPAVVILFLAWVMPASSQKITGGGGNVGGNAGIKAVYANGNVSGATTINWNNGQTQTATLTAATTLTFTNPVNGAFYCLSLSQDGTGGWAVTWPTTVLPPPIQFSSTNYHLRPSQTNSLCFIYDGTNYRVVGSDITSVLAIYDQVVDASNYSRLTLDGSGSGGSWTFATNKLGSGAVHDVSFSLAGIASMHFGMNSRNDDLKVDAGGQISLGQGPLVFPGGGGTALPAGAMYGVINNTSASAAIASTNTETFFDLGGASGKLPYLNTGSANCGTINCPQARFEIEAAGIYGTNGATDTIDLKWYLCQTSVACAGTKVLIADTGVITPGAGVSNQGWNTRVVCNVFTVGATGTVDCQGMPGAVFFTALATSKLDDIVNTGTATVSTIADEYVGLSATWNNNSGSNTITMRNLSVKIY